jgi:hypothetical protein
MKTWELVSTTAKKVGSVLYDVIVGKDTIDVATVASRSIGKNSDVLLSF